VYRTVRTHILNYTYVHAKLFTTNGIKLILNTCILLGFGWATLGPSMRKTGRYAAPPPPPSPPISNNWLLTRLMTYTENPRKSQFEKNPRNKKQRSRDRYGLQAYSYVNKYKQMKRDSSGNENIHSWVHTLCKYVYGVYDPPPPLCKTDEKGNKWSV
jgi:hypothetical protein